ncbi:MAG: CDP-archaeol synthase [Methylovirgula sp.]
MHSLVVLKLLVLLALANGSPIIAKWIFHERFARPLDRNLKLRDGRPLFGPAKTMRGILVSLVITSACAPLLGISFAVGLLVASAAMAGDLLSSFVKRRLGILSSGRATGLDQIPESLLPLLACQPFLSLTAIDIMLGTAVFFLGAVVLSQVLFRLHVRDRPY